MARTSPNVIITGTPGVGKTSHAEQLAERTGLKHISINTIVKDRECHEGWDEEYQSWIVDEDKASFFYIFLLSLLSFLPLSARELRKM
jgi:adenylate kinase